MNDASYHQIQRKLHSPFKVALESFLSASNITLNVKNITSEYYSGYFESPQVDLTLLDTRDCTRMFLNTDLSVGKLNKTLIFVDASVSKIGKVGAAILIPELSVKSLFRLPDNLPVYYAEAYAILKAIHYICDRRIQNSIIVSDSCHVLSDIKYHNIHKSPHPHILDDIHNLLHTSANKNITLVWHPGHSYCDHSTNIDSYAKLATKLPLTTQISFSTKEAISAADSIINNKWMNIWKSDKTCQYQYVFELSNSIKCYNTNRKRDVSLTRLRLQQSKLNSGLYKLGLHDTGDCEVCEVPENAQHFLLECTKTESLRINLKKIRKIKENWNLQFLLSNPSSLDIIGKFISENNIDI